MYQSPPESFGILCDIRSYRWLDTTPEQLMHLQLSAKAGTYKIFWDQHDRPLGYAIWANVCRESIQRLARTGRYPVYAFEWNDGRICLVLDVVFNNIDRKQALRQLKEFFGRRRAIAYKRRSTTRLLVRRRGRYERRTLPPG